MRKQQYKTKFKTILAIAAPILAAASTARAAAYNFSILYQINIPNAYDAVEIGAPLVSEVYPQVAAGGQVVGTGLTPTAQALLYNGTGNPIDLNPTSLGITSSFAYATNGAQQVGEGYGTGTSGNSHALLWTGSAGSAVDLNPANLGIINSFALGTNGSQQVGYGAGNATGDQALLWNGSAASAVNLNPTTLSGISYSFAVGTDGTNQVGLGNNGGLGASDQAVLWTGTAASAVNLNPTTLTGITQSVALGVSGNQQVGYGYPAGQATNDALLWTGTAASAVDLSTGLGLSNSYALDTNGSQQVGYGLTGSVASAYLWSGTAASAVDLQSFIPAADNLYGSVAYSIDASGDVFGISYAGVTPYAIEWTPVPEPASLSVLAFGAATLLARRQRTAP